jgi:cyclohexyl-isocyanide hydratase
MTQDRRDFLRVVGAAGAGLVASAGAASAAAATAPAAAASQPAAKPVHDMSAFPPSWTGKEQIAMLLYPGFTALDFVGPHYMFASLMGAKVHLVSATRAPVMSDTGLAIVPTATLANCPRELDVLFVPGGGQGTLNAMRNKSLVRWLADRGARAKPVASVCTGSLVLGQAGLVRGKKATSHWVTLDLLREFGATPVNERVVWDGALVTGAGVSAGIDLGLSIVGKLRDTEYAQGVQLLAEYAPKPPYDAGTPDRAPAPVKAMIASMFDGLRDEFRLTSRSALGG